MAAAVAPAAPERSPNRPRAPSSILLPCSSQPTPSKEAAGKRQLGWLANPPAELTAPRPAPPIVGEQPSSPSSVTSPPPVYEENESYATSTVPSLSPSASQDSVFESSVPSMDDEDDMASGGVTPRSSVAGASPSTKIRFGKCPERPPELRRRNSISLGVLSRKNMLTAQGTYNGGGGGGAGGGQGIKSVYMTDAEWEAYQAKFANKNTQQPVDLGDAVSKGAKKLFGKFRRTSTASNTSTSSSATSASVQPTPPRRGRSDSINLATLAHERDQKITGPPPLNRMRSTENVSIPPALHEAEEHHSAPSSPRGALGFTPGDETPRRGRSPSPVPQVFAEDDDEYAQDGEDGEDDDAAAKFRKAQLHHSSVPSLGFEFDHYRRPQHGSRRNSAHDVTVAPHPPQVHAPHPPQSAVPPVPTH